ncbi:MAG TPA: alpha/beta hydrolase [Ramlibacter sp.]
MDLQQPFFREVGEGPGVVCLHSNASTSSQWRALGDSLSPRFRVLAADSFGAGLSPAWPASGHSLRGEAELLEPVFARAGAPHFLVGHSYGGAVALLAAALDPRRVRAVVVYEPTLFALVDAQQPPPNGVDGIRHVALGAAAAAAAGDADSAARLFIDFWMGEGSWDAMPASRKPAVAQSVLNVGGWWRALAGDRTPLSAFAAIEAPVLYLTGGRSPESAHAVARVLAPVLRNARVLQFAQLGHMGPITHPALVNAEIERFLREH